ncbi:MAG TPA: hypothetical protein VN253_15450, partial [Kofleriaceae bacterium]|nr:hypothetical protein [Kofleriaceae bacterium]
WPGAAAVVAIGVVRVLAAGRAAALGAALAAARARWCSAPTWARSVAVVLAAVLAEALAVALELAFNAPPVVRGVRAVAYGKRDPSCFALRSDLGRLGGGPFRIAAGKFLVEP